MAIVANPHAKAVGPRLQHSTAKILLPRIILIVAIQRFYNLVEMVSAIAKQTKQVANGMVVTAVRFTSALLLVQDQSVNNSSRARWTDIVKF